MKEFIQPEYKRKLIEKKCACKNKICIMYVVKKKNLNFMYNVYLYVLHNFIDECMYV